MMFELVTWIRESDQPLFEKFSDLHPEIRVRNARLEKAEVGTASGLLVTGGPDISAQFHVEPVSEPELIRDPEPERDLWELEAIAGALERGLPILGICKGMQVLNVALGGTLHLHIEGHGLPEQRDSNIQALRYASSAQHRFERVNSSHHQAINRLGSGLEVEAWCADDDVIEQVRLRSLPFCVGVQYHPERDSYYSPLFEDFFTRIKNGPNRQTR